MWPMTTKLKQNVMMTCQCMSNQLATESKACVVRLCISIKKLHATLLLLIIIIALTAFIYQWLVILCAIQYTDHSLFISEKFYRVLNSLSQKGKIQWHEFRDSGWRSPSMNTKMTEPKAELKNNFNLIIILIFSDQFEVRR